MAAPAIRKGSFEVVSPASGEVVAAALDYGVVGINDPLPTAPQLPFGGLKRSGIGKEGGRAGIEEFLEIQLVSAARE